MTDEAGDGDRMIQPQRSAIAGDFVAYPSRGRITLLVLGSMAFVAIGLWLAGAFGPAPVTTRYPVEVTIAIGWSSVAFFGLCGMGWTKRLFDTRECVRIGPAGIRWTHWSDETIPWSEVADVRTWSLKRQRLIVPAPPRRPAIPRPRDRRHDGRREQEDDRRRRMHDPHRDESRLRRGDGSNQPVPPSRRVIEWTRASSNRST